MNIRYPSPNVLPSIIMNTVYPSDGLSVDCFTWRATYLSIDVQLKCSLKGVLYVLSTCPVHVLDGAGAIPCFSNSHRSFGRFLGSVVHPICMGTRNLSYLSHDLVHPEVSSNSPTYEISRNMEYMKFIAKIFSGLYSVPLSLPPG